MCYTRETGDTGTAAGDRDSSRDKMENWVKECLQRRKNGDKVEVSGPKGQVFQLVGQHFQQRHFFGLCPGCLKIGEHSACSGKGSRAVVISYNCPLDHVPSFSWIYMKMVSRLSDDLLLLQRLPEE